MLANGLVSAPRCDFSNPEPEARANDDAVLDPGRSVLCAATVSEVMDGVVHEDVTTVTATGVDSGTAVSSEAHFYATAEDDSVKLGDRVWLDTDRDGVQDVGEPGIGGVGLTLTGPDGLPAPDFIARNGTVGPTTTASDGSYTFKHLWPLPLGSRYTVTIDPTSPALHGLVPTVAGSGGPAQDSSTGSASSSDDLEAPGDQDTTLDFGFVTPPPPPPVTPPVTPPVPSKAPVALTTDASPETVVKGTPITVRGTVRRDGKAFATTTALEFQGDGTTAWTKVGKVVSTSRGALSASVTAAGSGSFRYRFAGTARPSPALRPPTTWSSARRPSG